MYEGKMHEMQGRTGSEKYRFCDSLVFLQSLEPRIDVSLEDAGGKKLFTAFCKAFVRGITKEGG